MLLKGISLNNQRVDFTLNSCPVTITENSIALVGKKGSQLLQAGTIVRGNEENKIFEGDIVYNNNEQIGIIVYVKGFVMQGLNGILKKVPEGQHIQVKEGSVKTIKEAVKCTDRSTILLHYKDTVFPLAALMFMTNGLLVASKLDSYLIEPSDVMFSTGFNREDGTALCFGEFYKGGTIILHNNIPCIQISEKEFIELQDND